MTNASESKRETTPENWGVYISVYRLCYHWPLVNFYGMASSSHMFESFDPNAVGGAQFCPQCATLLVLPETNPIKCERCAFSCHYDDLPQNKVITKSAHREIPTWLSTSIAEKKSVKDSNKERMTVDEPCPKCSHDWVEFYTVQLRSVDEGSTVFYECPSCGHNWSQNN